ncbi:MAG: outer membrane beta-barrel protein [Spirochaetes bacterium]|nr:outer membrane beta-barrel protein [Spirochaetota bacterium]
MKKLSLILVLLLAGTLVFAQTLPLSGGAGLRYTVADSTLSGTLKIFDTATSTQTKSALFGLGLFLDGNYVSVDLGLIFPLVDSTVVSTIGTNVTTNDYTSTSKITFLDLGLYLKYPVQLGSVVAFPVLGIEYDILLSAKTEDGDDISGIDNNLWVKLGAGLDFSLNKHLYLRPLVLFGIGIHTPDDAEQISNTEILANDVQLTKLRTDIGLKVGYRF